MDENITYLKLTPDNQELLTNKLVRGLFEIERSNKAVIGSATFFTEYKADLFYLLTKKENGRIFVIFSNNKPVGCCTGKIYGYKFGIYKLQVHNSFQNKRFGTKLKIRIVSDLKFKENIKSVFTEFSAKPNIKKINQLIANKRKNASNYYKLEHFDTTIDIKNRADSTKKRNNSIKKRRRFGFF